MKYFSSKKMYLLSFLVLFSSLAFSKSQDAASKYLTLNNLIMAIEVVNVDEINRCLNQELVGPFDQYYINSPNTYVQVTPYSKAYSSWLTGNKEPLSIMQAFFSQQWERRVPDEHPYRLIYQAIKDGYLLFVTEDEHTFLIGKRFNVTTRDENGMRLLLKPFKSEETIDLTHPRFESCISLFHYHRLMRRDVPPGQFSMRDIPLIDELETKDIPLFELRIRDVPPIAVNESSDSISSN